MEDIEEPSSVDFRCFCLCIAPQERMRQGGASKMYVKEKLK